MTMTPLFPLDAPIPGRPGSTSPRLARPLSLLLLALGLVTLAGCPEAEFGISCRINADCPQGQACISGACGFIDQPDIGMLPDAEPDPNLDPCALAPSPRRGQLVLNEILAAVPADERLGDVNGDGTRDTGDDEFLEFVNVTDDTLRVRGLRVFKGGDDMPSVVVETGCLGPRQALVVFGGLRTGASLPNLGGALVEISLKNFSLRNSGIELLVVTEDGNTLFDDTFPGAEGTSVNLDPELGSAFGRYVTHDNFDGVPFSPGTCADGKAFSTGCPPKPSECPGAALATAGSLLINEVLSAVPTEGGDANGDGVRSSSDDEFIELVNVSDQPVLLAGLRIFKEAAEKTRISTECLLPGQVLVLFAGLEPNAQPPALGGALVEITAATWGLTNGGSVLRIVDPDGAEVASVTLPAADGESLNRAVELDPNAAFVGHTRLDRTRRFSPGTCADGSPLSSGCPPPASPCPGAMLATPGALLINEVLSAVPTEGGDANGDGVRSSSDDEFIELVNVSDQPVLLAGLRIFKEATQKAVINTECLQPGQALVLFAGLEPNAALPTFPNALVEITTTTWGLTNGGTVLRLVGPGDAEILSLTLPSSANQSLTRQIDLDPNSPLVGHTALNPGLLFSPGACASGAPLSSGCPR